MDADRHLALLLTEGERLAAMPADALDAPVPTVEGWTLERVVRHTGKVHQWVTATVGAGPDADLAAVAADLPGIPRGPESLPAYREALHQVHAALAECPPDAPVATFVGSGTVGFWCRRQAHEVAVHRVDAADAVHAAGGPEPEPLASDGAVDGIDEWITVFLATRWNQRFGAFPDELASRSVHVHSTDAPGEWTLGFGDDGLEVRTEHTKADVALRGSAEALLLALWRRRSLSTIEVLGDHAVAERLLDVARF
jgi:uncharacterized protein (TIGR03083 family)